MWHEYYNPKLSKWFNAGKNCDYYWHPPAQGWRHFKPDSSHAHLIKLCKAKLMRCRTKTNTIYCKIAEETVTGTLELQELNSELETLMLTTTFDV